MRRAHKGCRAHTGLIYYYYDLNLVVSLVKLFPSKDFILEKYESYFARKILKYFRRVSPVRIQILNTCAKISHKRLSKTANIEISKKTSENRT